jgi:hypothetical protein
MTAKEYPISAEYLSEEERAIVIEAAQVVIRKIHLEVCGEPEMHTAYSAAHRCGCDGCIRKFNSWVDMAAWGGNSLDNLKMKTRSEKAPREGE